MSADLQAGRPGSLAADLLSTPEAGPAAIRGGALRVASFAAGSLFTIAAGALLFRHIGVVDTGRYTTALSLGAVVTGFTDLGLTAVGIRELATLQGERRARLARNLLGIRIALTLVGVAFVTAFAFIAYGPPLGFGVLITGAGVLVANVQTTLTVPLMADLRLGWVSALDLGRVLVTTALIVLFVVLGAGLLPFLTTPAIAAACVLVPTAVLIRADIPLRPAFELHCWRALIVPVFTYSIAVAAATLYFRIAIVLVSLLTSGAQLGYFSLSFRIVEALFAIPGLLVGAAFPIFARAARDDPARLGYAISRVFEVSLIVGAWVSLSLAVGAPLAVDLIGGERFAPAAPILAIAALGLGAAFVNAVWAFGMLSLHLHRLILAVALGSVAALAAVVAVLVVIDGARGAAIGTAAVEVGAAIAAGVMLVRGRPHLRPRLSIVPKVGVAALLACAPLLLVSGVPIGVELLASTLIYGVALLVLRAFPDELRELWPARLKRPV
ncbi:MAG: oligosaccharide flippase family protein [Actinomycetota bacterium]|nr:oligosaccharide flippase family protein [Actinomycetota bacterium]